MKTKTKTKARAKAKRVAGSAPRTPARPRAVAAARPLGDRVLARRIERDERSAGGIVIPGTAQEKSQQAEVLAVGPGRQTDGGQWIPLDVRAGDRVLIGKHAGTEFRIDGVDCVILREDDVLGILEGPGRNRQ